MQISMVRFIFLAILTVFLGDSLLAQGSVYTYRRADPQGTGKFYLGREIAPVMSHYGIDWLERSEREEEENASLLLKNMHLKAGEVVADIGAGSGYHVVRMANMVGAKGSIKAVDIQQEMLDFIGKRVKELRLKNVELVKSTEKSTMLPPGTVDKILMVDVYHELEFPLEMGQSMYAALKPGGLVYLIEYRTEDPKVPIKAVHKMTEQQAIKEMKALGLTFVKNISNLPWQHCLVFRK